MEQNPPAQAARFNLHDALQLLGRLLVLFCGSGTMLKQLETEQLHGSQELEAEGAQHDLQKSCHEPGWNIWVVGLETWVQIRNVGRNNGHPGVTGSIQCILGALISPGVECVCKHSEE